jgi:hypothetical protein
MIFNPLTGRLTTAHKFIKMKKLQQIIEEISKIKLSENVQIALIFAFALAIMLFADNI